MPDKFVTISILFYWSFGNSYFWREHQLLLLTFKQDVTFQYFPFFGTLVYSLIKCLGQFCEVVILCSSFGIRSIMGHTNKGQKEEVI